jgi:hypothetical protein
MTIHVSWDDADRSTLRYDFAHDWTWQGFTDALRTATTMTAQSGHKINVILNFGSTRTQLEGLLLHIRGLAQMDSLEQIVVVSNSPVVVSAFAVLAGVNRQIHERLVMATSLEEARVALNHSHFSLVGSF